VLRRLPRRGAASKSQRDCRSVAAPATDRRLLLKAVADPKWKSAVVTAARDRCPPFENQKRAIARKSCRTSSKEAASSRLPELDRCSALRGASLRATELNANLARPAATMASPVVLPVQPSAGWPRDR
jgi:hypothetical protein